MLFLANAVMKSPQFALLWTAVLGAATLMVSLFGLLSGAAVALVTLAVGLNAGIRTLMATLVGAAVVASLTAQWTTLGLAMVEFWLPAFVFAVVLGVTGSLSTMLRIATISVLIALIVVYGWIGTPETFWLQLLKETLSSWQAQDITIDSQAEQLLLEDLPSLLTMLVAMGLLMVWASMLLLARWWQTRLYPRVEDFATEFQQLSLGKGLAVVMLLLLLLVLLVPEQQWVQDALGVLSLAFMLQGLAVIHFWQAKKNTHKGWLVAIYILLGLLPQMMMMVATLGWLENWIHWRNKIALDSRS